MCRIVDAGDYSPRSPPLFRPPSEMGMSCGQCSHKYYFAEGIFCFCRMFFNLGVVLLCFSFDTPMAYPSNQWMSRSRVRCFEQVRVFRGPQNAEGVPISLVKWGWGGPHITRDMGTGVPISRLHRVPIFLEEWGPGVLIFLGEWGPLWEMGTPSVADHFLGIQSSFPLAITD